MTKHYKASYKALKKEKTSHCRFCNAFTNSALTLKDGSEVWACIHCAKKQGKLKRNLKIRSQCLDSSKQTILSDNSFVESQEKGIEDGGQ